MRLEGTRPVTKGRPRLTRRKIKGQRRVYTPHNTVVFEKAIRNAWEEQHKDEPALTGPVSMTVIIGSDWIEVQVEELEESHRPRYVQGDIDNYVKSISDGLNGVAYKDDKQVHHLEVWFEK